MPAFGVNTTEHFWLVWLFIKLTGGLGIFLFGMFFLNDALQKIAGKRLRNLLITMTKSPWRGLGTGIFATGLNQSSSATTALEVSLVSAGLLTFYQTMAVTMGAEIGSTVTAQLVAFNIADAGILIAGGGFFISFAAQSANNKRVKYIGDTIIGVGLLFLGMKIMSDLLTPLKHFQPFMDLMKETENPLYGIFIGCAFTFLIHSSGATSGIVIALALAGAITLEQAIPINLGAMIGTCVTAVMSAIGRTREGKRVAVWHVVHQTFGVLLVLPFITVVTLHGTPVWILFVHWVTGLFFNAQDVARQIAMAHTLISVVNTLIFLPFLPLMHRLLLAVYPPKEEEKPFGPQYIDEGLLNEPAIALEQARKEVVRQGELVQEMLRESMVLLENQSLKMCETVSLKDIRVDALHTAIVHYLSLVSQGYLTEPLAEMQVRLLYISADIEEIGDIIDKNILAIARKKLENKLWFSQAGWQDIVELHENVLAQYRNALSALRTWDVPLAAQISDDKPTVSRRIQELRRKHIERINQGVQESLETASIHQDLIDQLKHINSHTASIAHAIHGKV